RGAGRGIVAWSVGVLARLRGLPVPLSATGSHDRIAALPHVSARGHCVWANLLHVCGCRDAGGAQGPGIRSGGGILMNAGLAALTPASPDGSANGSPARASDQRPLIRIENVNHYFGQGEARKQV